MPTLKTQAELEALKVIKLATQYKVKDAYGAITKDVDMSKRTVQVIPNTYLFFDSDCDVLIPGCSAKTIKERGPLSNAVAKIKNVKDHNICCRIGKPEVLDERK